MNKINPTTAAKAALERSLADYVDGTPRCACGDWCMETAPGQHLQHCGRRGCDDAGRDGFDAGRFYGRDLSRAAS